MHLFVPIHGWVTKAKKTRESQTSLYPAKIFSISKGIPGPEKIFFYFI